MMTFKGKVTAGNEMDFSVGQDALECLGSGGNERGIVLFPYCQQRWLIVAQVFLELRIKSHIRAVVKNQVVLHLGTTRQVHIIVIETIGIRTYAAFRCAEGVLDCSVTCL